MSRYPDGFNEDAFNAFWGADESLEVWQNVMGWWWSRYGAPPVGPFASEAEAREDAERHA